MANVKWLLFSGSNGREYAFNVERVRCIEDLGEGRVDVDGETVYANYEEVVQTLGEAKRFTSDADYRRREREERKGGAGRRTEIDATTR